MTRLIKVKVTGLNPRYYDLDDPNDLERLRAVNWSVLVEDLDYGEVMEFRCLEGADQ